MMRARRRAQHKKSRNGCMDCKQRHMKCDETRPRCGNCRVVGRPCKYAETVVVSKRAASRGSRADSITTTTSLSPQDALLTPIGTPNVVDRPSSASNDESCRESAATDSPSTPLERPPVVRPDRSTPSGLAHHPAPPRPPPDVQGQVHLPGVVRQQASSGDVRGAAARQVDAEQEVNLDHAELLIHFATSTAATVTPDLDPELLAIGSNLVLQRSLGTPCLLHQILAISARHLSHLRPDRCEFYARQAVHLQTRAIELFNATKTIDKTNCEAMILFVGFLNRHLLADLLSNREGDATAFLERFIRTAQVQRGIRIIYDKTSTILLESDLGPLVRAGTSIAMCSSTVGKECEMLRQLISLTPTLDPIAKEACRMAVHFLQVGFDDVARSPGGNDVFRLVFCWGAHFPDEFLALLRERRPEAVAVMGWYAVLLDHGRGHWAIGDAAVFVLRSVSCFLGPEWAHWLQWPMQMLADRLA